MNIYVKVTSQTEREQFFGIMTMQGYKVVLHTSVGFKVLEEAIYFKVDTQTKRFYMQASRGDLPWHDKWNSVRQLSNKLSKPKESLEESYFIVTAIDYAEVELRAMAHHQSKLMEEDRRNRAHLNNTIDSAIADRNKWMNKRQRQIDQLASVKKLVNKTAHIDSNRLVKMRKHIYDAETAA